MTLARRTITPALPEPTHKRPARYDYRNAMDPARPRWADLGPTRTAKADGDIEITSRGTFIWQDGLAVPYRRAGA